jgi:hypothetical protein
MRFLIAAVVVFGTMTVSFESNSDFSRDLQETTQDASAFSEPNGDEEVLRLRQVEAHAGIEPKSVLSTGIAPSELEPPKPDEPKKDFCEALQEAAESSDIPIAFFARLLWQESKFKPDVVSHVGAQGIAQFMPGTAAEVGLDDPFDPFKALPASAKLLRRLHNQFGNLGLAAAAYNAGSGRIQRWLSRRGALPQETRDYVRIITGNIAENWLEESKRLNLPVDLPRGAPCEGVGGLTTAKTVDVIPVGLAPSISDTIRRAEAEAVAERRAALRPVAAAKAKSKVALSLQRRKARLKELTSNATSGRKAAGQPRKIRLASATKR